ncbi:Variant surface glycoprotein [Trypanosoma congolense IL3000]|uniref:Variant surface glycoprotein n=1 Tax=Trypanosoma congolense (strain IL3000) TaxID=1068625 RepID=F9W8A8_TRYCI|nr:Variant surface glycoprotein [Trypanosoma congolense IL3000]
MGWRFMVTVLFSWNLLCGGILVYGNNGYNSAEYLLLCNLTRKVSSLLKSGGISVNAATNLRDAIYGVSNRALFKEGGEVHLGLGCSKLPNGRALQCSYYNSDGCFAESLIGAFFCACTPSSREGGVNTFCGVDANQYHDSWTGEWVTPGRKTNLFKDVWKYVIGDCHEKHEIMNNKALELEYLKLSVKEVRRKIEEDKRNNGFFYLGGSGNTVCNGYNVNDVCVRYNGKGTSVVKIPWIDKLEEAIKELGKTLETQEREVGVKDSRLLQPGALVPVKVHKVLEKNTGQGVQNKASIDRTKKQFKERMDETEIHGRQESAEYEHKSTEARATSNSPSITDIPHLATNNNEDGSIITRPSWLLLSISFV